jgi:REP element-mobilizing transposase RayT
LSQYGEIVDKWILEIPKQYQDISVECYVIMPNHIHLLLSVIKENGRGDPSPTVGSAMGWFKYHATKEINQLRNTVGEKIFQRSFYDHIVRNCDDYREIYKYIHENPKRWLDDCFFTEE